MNFRRRLPRGTRGSRSNWWSWRSDSVIRKLARQARVPSVGRPPKKSDFLKTYEEEAAMWNAYLEENYGDENW